MAVAVTNQQRRVPIPRGRVCRIAAAAMRALGRPGAEVHLTFVDDARVKRLNGRYRGTRRATDVLAFRLEGPGPSALLGEVIVSAETASRQARRLGIPVGRELELMVVHGILHLVGWDDRNPLEARLMHERERAILRRASGPVPERLWSGLLKTA
ncbi:MAG: rRNA maturation RNase YbeY [Candidatus Rokubacteria bacterium]|nr:rRNA maturation RNase YbeY [Candidatus Rokubacteria bacterium]